jgi:uncharacterized glyoxalase superfamily protein PhnB
MASTVIPGMQYRDAPAAIEWLCRVLGFEKHAVHTGEGGTVMHAELTLGGGMIMLGSASEKSAERGMALPGDLGGAQTRSAYLVVHDADAVYGRVREAGARIVEQIEDKPFGGRGVPGPGGLHLAHGDLRSVGEEVSERPLAMSNQR